jgi:hypothetical protein
LAPQELHWRFGRASDRPGGSRVRRLPRHVSGSAGYSLNTLAFRPLGLGECFRSMSGSRMAEGLSSIVASRRVGVGNDTSARPDSVRMVGVVNFGVWIVWVSLATLIGLISQVMLRHHRSLPEHSHSERLTTRDGNGRRWGQRPSIPIGFLLDRDWSGSLRGLGLGPNHGSVPPSSSAKRRVGSALRCTLVR